MNFFPHIYLTFDNCENRILIIVLWVQKKHLDNETDKKIIEKNNQ